jgi:hypothetical protein
MGAATAMLTSLAAMEHMQWNIQAIHHCHATDFDAVSFYMIAIAFFIPERRSGTSDQSWSRRQRRLQCSANLDAPMQ